MYIKNEDLEFLIDLEYHLAKDGKISFDDYIKLRAFNERLMQMREKDRERTRAIINERRKIDKNYARSKPV